MFLEQGDTRPDCSCTGRDGQPSRSGSEHDQVVSLHAARLCYLALDVIVTQLSMSYVPIIDS
jgi:hypothetical protein